MNSSRACAALVGAALLVSSSAVVSCAGVDGSGDPPSSGAAGEDEAGGGGANRAPDGSASGAAAITIGDAGPAVDAAAGDATTAGTPGGPAAAYLPAVFGTCPAFVGDGAKVTFQTSRGDRPVRMWISSAAQTLDGPLVFYWHGWHGSPGLSGISTAALKQLLAMGGLFVAPYIEPNAPDDYWSSADLVTADQVVACAIATVGIDTRRIHSIGYSAGGMQTYRMIHERSGYLASAVMYSPGTNGGPGPRQETQNKIASIITWGDTEETIFHTLAEQYFDRLKSYGFFAMMCHHSGGHIQPGAVRDRALDFLLAHPFGTDPSPFAAGIPSNYPSYCSLTK